MICAVDISPTDSISAEVNFVHTFHQVDTFTAVLSVPYKLRRNVYWKRQSLSINVKTNEILKLQTDVDFLKSQVIYLEGLIKNLTEEISSK